MVVDPHRGVWVLGPKVLVTTPGPPLAPTGRLTRGIKMLGNAQIPLCQLCDFHRNFPSGKIMDTNHESLRHKSCRRPSWFVSVTKSVDFVYCNELNSIRTTQMGLSRTCHGLCCKHRNMSRWSVSATFTETSWFHYLSPFESATFMICVRDFPRRKASMKISVMEFGLNRLDPPIEQKLC